jgi:predicted phosphodiesterase
VKLDILIVGDSHGNVEFLNNAVAVANELDVDILQLGDFGIWPGKAGKEFLQTIEQTLKLSKKHLYFIDGNHDWPGGYRAFPQTEEGFRSITPHITHLARGAHFNWNGVTIGSLGGAFSIDHAYRVPGKSWWSSESPSPEEAELLISRGPVSILLTHDSSNFEIPPPFKYSR